MNNFLIKESVIIIMLCFCVNSFALNSNKIYPWYFEPNKIEECWNVMINGKDIVVDVLDTKISFVSVLQNKEAFSENYVPYNHRPLSEAEEIHGTAMAGLIAGDYAILECKDEVKSWCEIEKKSTAIAGVAPGAKIISREWMPNGDLEEVIISSSNNRALENKRGVKIRDDKGDANEVKIILLNISAGKKKH